jgi:hypothetical protein
VLAHLADGLAVGLGGAALLDELERRLVGVFDAEQEAFEAGLAVEVEDVGVADDVVGARRADDRDAVELFRLRRAGSTRRG